MKNALIFPLLGALVAGAVEVTPEMAARAARNWRTTKDVLECPLGRTVASARTVATAQAKFNVVRFAEGGFVVTAADTSVRPIVFFSDGDDLDEDPQNPLFALLEQDAAICAEDATTGRARLAAVAPGGAAASVTEREWAELLAEPAAGKASLAAVSVSDIRRGPLLKTAWDQRYVGGLWCYNYYTPEHYYCGCVATAMAQVMRYFQWPTSAVTARTNPNCTVSGTTTSLTMKGGTYDWANMPLSPTSSHSTTLRGNIGKICYDAGVAVGMKYASGGSTASVPPAAWALKNVFGYSQAIASVRSSSSLKSSSSAHTRQAMLTNLDAWLPVIVGMEGHSIVVDGYGYSSGSLCYHLNYGWGGSSNGWYRPPDLGNGNTVFGSMVYNIYESQLASRVIVSGRVLTSAGKAASGVTVQALQGSSVKATATTDAKGIFALFVAASETYTIKATRDHDWATATAKTSAIVTVDPVLKGGMPNRNVWGGDSDAAICNAHVGDMWLYTEQPVAAVDGTLHYNTTFAKVCQAAQAGQTVVLLRDTSEAVVMVPTACTVDLGGHTLTGTLYAQNDSGTLTVMNGTITGAAVSVDGAIGTASYPNGTVVLEDVTCSGMVLPDDHPLVFTSGTYAGAVHVGPQGATINGGRFADLVLDAGVRPVVADGAFARDFSDIATIAAGTLWSESSGDADYPWTVIAQPVARLGAQAYYSTLAEAYSEATDGETITLLANHSADFTLETAVTLDLGGFTFGGVLTVAGDATVTNGTLVALRVTAGRTSVAGGRVEACTQTERGRLVLAGGTISSLLVTNCLGNTRLVGGRVGRLVAVGGTEIRADADSTCVVDSLSADQTRVVLDGGTFGIVRLMNSAESQMLGAGCRVASLTMTNCPRTVVKCPAGR